MINLEKMIIVIWYIPVMYVIEKNLLNGHLENAKIQFVNENGFVDPALREYDKHLERKK